MKTAIELRDDVEAELDWDPRFDARDIGVSAKAGVVTLTGTVATYAEKNAAEEAVRAVAGVRAIANDIEVVLDDTAKRSDSDIAAAALASIKSNVALPGEAIKVIVRDGWITLEGEVPMRFQAEMAEQAVQNLWGIKGTFNNIVVKAPSLAAAIDAKIKIEDAFRRHAQLDANAIAVSVDHDKLILTGEVHSLRERDVALAAAWSAPGVKTVENLIRVQP